MPTPEEIEEERERILADVDEARASIDRAQPSTAGMRDEPDEPDATAEEMREATGRALEGLERGSLVPPPPRVGARDMPPSAPSPFSQTPAAPELRAVTSSTPAAPERASALGSPSPFPSTPPAAAPAPDVDDGVEDRALASIAEGPSALGSPSPTTEETPPMRPEPPQAPPAPAAPTAPDEVEGRAVDRLAEGASAEPAAPPQPLTPAQPAVAETPTEPESAEELAESSALSTLAGEPTDRASSLGSPAQQPGDDGFRARSKDFIAQQEARVREIERLAQEAREAGIPTEGDIADARLRRGLLSPLAALASALQVRAGMTPQPRGPGEVERLEAQRTRMLGERREARRDEQQQAAAAAQRTREGRELDLRERQLTQQGDIARQNAARQATAAESQAASARTQQALNEDRLTGSRADRALADRRRLFDSDESRSAQANVRAQLEGAQDRRPQLRAEFAPVLARLPSMSAEEIDAMMRGALGRRLASSGQRISVGGGGGGGGGGAALEGLAIASDVRLGRLEEAGTITADQRQRMSAAVRSRDRRVRQEAAAALDDLERSTQQGVTNTRADTRLTQATQAQELIPGSGIRAGARVAESAVNKWREGFAGSMTSMSGLRRVARIADRFRGARAFGVDAAAELAPEITMLRQMVAQMGGTGVISPTEVPNIDRALPDPSDPRQSDMTFGTFGSRLRQWRSILEDAVRAQAVSLGVDAAGQDRIIRSLRQGGLAAASIPEGGGGGGGARAGGGAPAAAPARGGQRFRLYRTGPDGREQRVPRELTEAEIAAFRGENGQPRSGFRIEEVR